MENCRRPLTYFMKLALAIALSFCNQSGSRPPAELAFYSFFDQLAISEIQVQIDRFAAADAKHSKGQRTKLAKDLENSLAILRNYEATGLPALAATNGDERFSRALRVPLDSMISSVTALESFVQSHEDEQKSPDEARLQNAQFAGFYKVVGACENLPHFSADALNPAAYYNLSPRLRDDRRFAILADPQHPNEARVWRTIGLPHPKLHDGDKVAGYWMPNDKKWIDVKSWRDVIAAPDDAADSKTHLMLLKVRRHGTEIQVSVTFVPATEEAE